MSRDDIPTAAARRIPNGLRLALVLLLAAIGALLLIDRSGLRADYFALGAPWRGNRLATTVGEPALKDLAQAAETLTTKAIFSIRWSGWWDVRQEGEHPFFIVADDGGFLRVDGELVVNTVDALGERREYGVKALTPGFHEVEIGLLQTSGESRLGIQWAPPALADESASSLPLADLYSGRPLLLRRCLRWAFASWPPVGRQLLGALLLLVACSLLARIAERSALVSRWVPERLRAIDGRGLRTALLFALFAATFVAVFPFTGTVRGGDDTSYLTVASFGAKSWFYNRYAHVYLLKLFVTLCGGDPLVGVRVWWSFAMATTVAALAVAVRSIGPRLQLRTLAVTLFVLVSQPILFGLIGAGFADFSAMMWVTVAVAICLHGFASDRERPAPRPEWHALALGAVTVCAARSKEVGTILLLLPMLFLIGQGAALDLRRFARKMAWWTAGAVAAQLALMLLDAWILGDFFFTTSGNRLWGSRRLNFPPSVPPRGTHWLDILLEPEMRNLWLGVAAAAIAAGVCRRRLELRLLHLLPISFVMGLVVLYIRLPHPFSSRMLIPILPVACLMTGLLLHYAGLDELPWRQLVRPAFLLPVGLAAATLFLVVVPYLRGTFDAATVLPVKWLLRYGWTPEQFVVGVLLPTVVLILLSWAALGADRGQVRVVALLVAFLTLFGVGFDLSVRSLAQHRATQVGDLLLYPWRTFRAELDAGPAHSVAIAEELQLGYEMSAKTRTALAQLVLGRRDLRVTTTTSLPTEADAAIASRETYGSWLEQMPSLAPTARFDPAGFLVLVRPKEAAGRERQLQDKPASAERKKKLSPRTPRRPPRARDR